MKIFDTIAERLGTTRHTAMVLVLLGVLAAAWYISRHLPAVGTSATMNAATGTSAGTSADTRMNSNTSANDTTYNAAASALGLSNTFGSGVPGVQPPIQPPNPAPPPQQQVLSAYGGMYGSPGWNPPPIPAYPYPFKFQPPSRF